MKRAVLVLGGALASCGAPEAKLTESQEYYAGRAVSASIIKKYELLEDAILTDYVNLIGHTIARASDRPETYKGYLFGILKGEEPNAFAAPSGFIWITTGLLRLCATEDELAAVLAHEIGHVNQKHPELALEKARQDKMAAQAAVEGAAGVANVLTGGQHTSTIEALRKAFSGIMADLVEKLVSRGYERDQEFEADLKGLDYLVREGVRYDPNALIAVLDRMASMPKKHSYGWLHGSTHPEPAERRDRAAAYIKEKGYTGATDSGRTQRFVELTKSLK
jgi:predicted Zn-dependent protease